MKKKLLVVLALMCVALSVTACKKEDVEESKEAVIIEVTEAPAETATPKVTATPKATVTPKATEEVVASETPIEAPKENVKSTETPKVTVEPTATPKPTMAPTKAPTVTEAPKATSVPTQAPTPKPTNTPKPACINHSWDGGNVTVAATCANEGSKTYTCTNCGATKSESIGKTDHSWYEYSWTAPTCIDRGYSNWMCSTCGAQDDARSGNTEPLGHTTGHTETLGSASDCQHCTVIVTYCGRCGAELGRSEGETGGHVWNSYEETYFDETILENVTVTVERCGLCGTSK